MITLASALANTIIFWKDVQSDYNAEPAFIHLDYAINNVEAELVFDTVDVYSSFFRCELFAQSPALIQGQGDATVYDYDGNVLSTHRFAVK